MITYKPGDDIGPLEAWPFDNPASEYRITQGSPIASGRLDAGGPGYVTRTGIWHCTRGTFDCTEQGDELMTILSGSCEITDRASGTVTALVAGDSHFVRDGSRVTWRIIQDVTKVFFAHKADGY